MNQKVITNFLHSRNFATLLLVAAIVATCIAFSNGRVHPVGGSRGIALISPNLWISNPVTSLFVGLTLLSAIAVSCVIINKAFNIMRAQTALWAAFFMMSAASMPTVAGQFYGGTLLCAVMVASCIALFSCFGDTSKNKRIFLIFFMLSLGALMQYAFMFYIVIIFPGMAQMRILNFRSITAAVLGIIAPQWILFGCGVLNVDDLRWPEFVGTLSVLRGGDMIASFVTIGVTMMLGIVAFCGNIMKILSYTAKYRAANGFLALLMIFTMLLILIDYNNLAIYMPLLCFTTAYQIAHFFSNNRVPRSYIAILSLIALFLGMYIFNFIF